MYSIHFLARKLRDQKSEFSSRLIFMIKRSLMCLLALFFVVAWYPKHISELDFCNHLVTKFEPELDMDHPGWTDHAYRDRRKEIAQLSFDFRQ